MVNAISPLKVIGADLNLQSQFWARLIQAIDFSTLEELHLNTNFIEQSRLKPLADRIANSSVAPLPLKVLEFKGDELQIRNATREVLARIQKKAPQLFRALFSSRDILYPTRHVAMCGLPVVLQKGHPALHVVLFLTDDDLEEYMYLEWRSDRDTGSDNCHGSGVVLEVVVTENDQSDSKLQRSPQLNPTLNRARSLVPDGARPVRWVVLHVFLREANSTTKKWSPPLRTTQSDCRQ
ncbi:MAG: hypothetical protein J3Q66DRAFT_374687 [Benniella sp.]|nr:MAG: hypothetical protein J3Q66DRAFT_374687 [Benniella sp.]